MIGKLTGRIEAHGADILIETGGVGYLVRAPLGTLEAAGTGKEVTLYIHTAVREDAIDLYGFATEVELRFFRQLLDVSGVGPKTALGVLNVADVPTLKAAIARGDATALTKVFGIGKKSAERIVVELRDKLAKEAPVGLAHASDESNDAEVIEALMALGYSAPESREALKGAGKDAKSVRERLSAALKELGSK